MKGSGLLLVASILSLVTDGGGGGTPPINNSDRKKKRKPDPVISDGSPAPALNSNEIMKLERSIENHASNIEIHENAKKAIINNEYLINDSVDNGATMLLEQNGLRDKAILFNTDFFGTVEAILEDKPNTNIRYHLRNPVQLTDVDVVLENCIENLTDEKIEKAERVYFMILDHKIRFHYYIAVYERATGVLTIYDSLVSNDLEKYEWTVTAMSSSLLAIGFRVQKVVIGSCQKQPDGISCGVYAIKFIESLIKGETIPISGFDANGYRKKIYDLVSPYHDRIINDGRRLINDSENKLKENYFRSDAQKSPNTNTDRKKRKITKNPTPDNAMDIHSDNISTEPIANAFRKKLDFSDFVDSPLKMTDIKENNQMKYDPKLVKAELIDEEYEKMNNDSTQPIDQSPIIIDEEGNYFDASTDWNNDDPNPDMDDEEVEPVFMGLSSFLSLNGTRWVNDEVIDVFMHMFKDPRRFMSERCKRNNNGLYKKVLPIPSQLFMRSLTGRVMKDENVYRYDFAPMPYMYKNHWKLCVFVPSDNKAIIFDSLQLELTGFEKRRIKKVWNDLRNEEIRMSTPKLIFEKNPPKYTMFQDDCYNCGIYVCLHAFNFMGDKDRPDTVDLAYERERLMYFVIDSQHIGVKDDDGIIIESRELIKIRKEDIPEADKWFDNHLTEVLERRKAASDLLNSHNATIDDDKENSDVEMADVSVQFQITVKTTSDATISMKTDSKTNSMKIPAKQRKKTLSMNNSESKETTANMNMDPELIDEFFEKMIGKDSDSFLFPVSAWNFAGIIDKIQKHVISLTMSKRIVIPFTTDNNFMYALLIVEKGEKGRWKGSLFDPTSKSVTKDVREKAKSFFEKYGLKGVTITANKENIPGTTKPFSGIYICTRIVGVITGKFENDLENSKKLVETCLAKSVLPWLQSVEADSGQNIEKVDTQTIQQAKAAERKRNSRMSITDGTTIGEQEKLLMRTEYAKTKLGKGRVYVKKEAAYNSKALPAPFVFDKFVKCIHCDADRFPSDPPSFCCKDGSVIVPDEWMTTPDCMKQLREYLMIDCSDARQAIDAIRMMNSFLSFVGTNSKFLAAKDLPKGGPVPVILDGQYLNGVCNLLPNQLGQVKFAQLAYCSENTVAAKFEDYFTGIGKKLGTAIRKVFLDLRRIVLSNNPFSGAYQAMYDVMTELAEECKKMKTKMPHVMMTLKEKREVDPSVQLLAKGIHPGTTTKPVLDNQVFAIYTTDDGQLDYDAVAKGTFVFVKHNTFRKCQNIVPWSANFFSLKFPFLFFGEQPFNSGLIRAVSEKSKLKVEEKKVSFREIAVSLLRRSVSIEKHRLLGYGKLTQEVVIAFEARDEFDKLSYMKKMQIERSMLKGTTVNAQREYIESQLSKEGIKLGHFVTMTSMYPGGRAHKERCYHDSMAINRRFGHAHLFVTFTGKWSWDPIIDNVAPNNTPYDDPMLITRTFDNVLRELKKDLFEKGVLGEVKAWVLSKEFQKRGMPHAHILITLKNGITEDIIDELISAELPEKPDENNPEFKSKPDHEKEKEWRYYQTVKDNMIHGPCEADDGTRFGCRKGLAGAPLCAKGYPKTFQEKTTLENGKYANYKRPNNKRSIIFGDKKSTRVADNRHVVPHNKWLATKYGCHINVEIVASIESQRYVHKYFFKGFDQCFAEIKTLLANSGDLSKYPGMRKEGDQWIYDYDETRMYMMCRVKSAPEAAFRLLSMDHAEMSHVVSALSVHLPDHQKFTFKEDEDEKAVKEKADHAKSNLMMYMEACKENLNVLVDGREVSVRTLTFAEADERLRVDQKKYVPYKINVRKITRLIPVSPRRQELYALYVMVLSAKGYESFDDLLTDDNGVKYDTFTEAARKKGYLKDETEWDDCLARVSDFSFPYQMRSLFATIIIQGNASNIPFLWDKYKSFLHPRDKEQKMSEAKKDRVALAHIQSIIRHHGMTLGQCNLPEVGVDEVKEVENLDYQMTEIKEEMEKTDAILTDEQRSVSDAVFDSVEGRSNRNLHFLEASGGCGKTVLTNYVINRALLNGRKVVVMASSGVTAILLRNGRTVHSTFGVELHLKERKEPPQDVMTSVGKYLLGTELIIWDEAPMMNKFVMYWVSDTMKNLVPEGRSGLPFGGVTVLMSGDWKQTLCITQGVRGEAILPYTLKGATDLWPFFRIHKLSKNLRVKDNENEFRQWLEEVGRGSTESYGGNFIEIPESVVAKTKEDAIEHVFPKEVLDNPTSMTGRMLLCMTNEQVLSLNDNLMSRFKGDLVEMVGITEHELSAENETPLDSLEDLQGRTPGGLPPHILRLKKGSPVVLLRNINLVAGLCNGTRMIVEDFLRNDAGAVICIMCRNISDTSKNNHVFPIPRIRCSYESPMDGLSFARTQFPLWPAFVMTVNKAQGQTLSKVGLILESEPFAHGQTYVALSRVRCPSDIKIYTPRTIDNENGKKVIKNIVYENIIW